MEGIIQADYTDKKDCKLIKILPDGTREYYEPSANGFVLKATYPAPATSDHIHSKVTAKIKTDSGILVFENGILTEIVKG